MDIENELFDQICDNSATSSNDTERAFYHIKLLNPQIEIEDIESIMFEDLKKTINDAEKYWQEIELVANMILDKDVIEGKELDRLIEKLHRQFSQ